MRDTGAEQRHHACVCLRLLQFFTLSQVVECRNAILNIEVGDGAHLELEEAEARALVPLPGFHHKTDGLGIHEVLN